MPTLDWIGKKAVLNHHRQIPYHLLKSDSSLSVGEKPLRYGQIEKNLATEQGVIAEPLPC